MSNSLESDLRQLMAALKTNNADDWPGKPVQEPLFVPAADEAEGDAPVAVQLVSASTVSTAASSSSQPPGAEAERQSLDALMSEYVGAVAATRREAAPPQAPPPPAAEAPQSLQELLDALDDLPPLQTAAP